MKMDGLYKNRFKYKVLTLIGLGSTKGVDDFVKDEGVQKKFTEFAKDNVTPDLSIIGDIQNSGMQGKNNFFQLLSYFQINIEK